MKTFCISFALLALTFGGAATLTGQTGDSLAPPDEAHRASSNSTVPAQVPDSRLLVRPTEMREAIRSRESGAWADSVTRPRWRYPAIGAAVGVIGGVIHASAITQGDYVGLPVEPMLLLPVAYGAVGAFVGILVDSAERERAARR